MKSFLAVILLFASFAISGPTDSTDVAVDKCREIEHTATGHLVIGVPIFVSTLVFFPVPALSYTIFRFYLASAAKISANYSHEGCVAKSAPHVALR